MGKSLKLKATLLATCIAVSAVTGAAAQSASNSLGQLAGLTETLSAGDISSMMSQYSITTQLAPYEDNGAATIIADTSGGARFLISLFDCADPVAGTECKGAATYTAFSNAGYAYDDINQFNTQANVSKAVNVAETNVVVFGMQRYFKGGVSQDNVSYGVVLFLQDMQTFLDGRTASQTQVSLDTDEFDTQNQNGSKIESVLPVTQTHDEAFERLVASAGRPALETPLAVDDVSGIFSPRHSLSAAINNTTNVTFADKD